MENQTKKPHWWSAAHDLSWSKIKAELVEDWHKVAAGAKKLEKEAAEQAIQFGHGARDNFKKFDKWTDELGTQLEAEWKRSSASAGKDWNDVKDAVRHGWEKTKPTK